MGLIVLVSLAFGRVPHHPYVSRHDAMVTACPGCTANMMTACPGCTFRREAKLMRFSDLARAEPSFANGLNESDANSYVWAVASEGQTTGINGGSGWPWTIWLVKDEPGKPQLWGAIGGVGEYIATPIVTWPPYWDSLPDYAFGR